MNRLWILCLAAYSSFFGFEKLDSKYCIQYGNPDAESKAVEYFSLSCPKCTEFFIKEFPAIKEKHIDTGDLFWSFHPDPADLLTLQAMVCLGRLPPEKKALFLEALMENLAKLRGNIQGCKLIQTAMEVFHDPIPELQELEFLKKTEAFENAYRFVTQEDALTVIPSVEIDGVFYKKPPTISLIDTHLKTLKRSS
jgi:Thioredoxin